MQITRSLKFGAAFKLMLAAGVVSTLAACGGSDSVAVAQPTTLTISGTAVTGLAIAGGTVSVTCVSGTGTATTAANGTYSVAVTGVGAKGPCVISVSKAAVGTAPAINLRSVVQIAGGVGTANVNPLTELLVQNIINRSPTSAANLITPAQLVADVGFVGVVSNNTLLDASVAQVTTSVQAAADAAGVVVDPTLLTNFLTKPIVVGDAADLTLDALKAATVVADTGVFAQAVIDEVKAKADATEVVVVGTGVTGGSSSGGL